MFITRDRCPVCGSATRETLLETKFTDPSVASFLVTYYDGRIPLDALTDQSYRLDRCRNCALIYQAHILTDAWMMRLYEEWIDAQASLDKRRSANSCYFAALANEVAGIAKFAPGIPSSVRVLDIGMGWGHWARMAMAHGYETHGYELSARRSIHAASMGIRVLTNLDPREAGAFDYIYCSQVLEHVADPGGMMDQMLALLRPGGVVDLHVPNQGLITTKLRRPDWTASHNAVHPLEHINCFSRTTLRYLASERDMQLVAAPFPHRRTTGTFGIRDLGVYLYNRTLSTHVWLRRAQQPRQLS